MAFGGGGVWTEPSFDPETNLAYFGTGNPVHMFAPDACGPRDARSAGPGRAGLGRASSCQSVDDSWGLDSRRSRRTGEVSSGRPPRGGPATHRRSSVLGCRPKPLPDAPGSPLGRRFGGEARPASRSSMRRKVPSPQNRRRNRANPPGPPRSSSPKFPGRSTGRGIPIPDGPIRDRDATDPFLWILECFGMPRRRDQAPSRKVSVESRKPGSTPRCARSGRIDSG